MENLYFQFLEFMAGSMYFDINLIRIAIFIIFIWIGALKFCDYEAEGIVPLVANSPFMSFFYKFKAPEYKNYMMKEGAVDPEKHAWHVRNNTYGFSHGLGILIMSIGTLVLLGIFFPVVGLIGEILCVIMTCGTLSFMVTTPEIWVPNLGGKHHGFPYLGGPGRLIIKDLAIMAGAIVCIADSAQTILLCMIP